MTNALREFKNTLDDLDYTIDDISSMVIVYMNSYTHGPKIIINSEEGYLTLADIANLDFEYDDGYGSQELFGVVVFKDGTWLDREEYDGSEWWDYRKCPTYNDIIAELCKLHVSPDYKDDLIQKKKKD